MIPTLKRGRFSLTIGLLGTLGLFVGLFVGAGLRAAETIPQAPARFFNDYANTVPPGDGNAINAQLEQYERDSSNQILVVIYPKMESASSVEDYTVRVAQSWRVGQKAKNNGAVLFVFVQQHQIYIQVGYGLEPTLTDATAHEIIATILTPAFRRNDYAGGLRQAVAAMIAATKGEYHGTGRTVDSGNSSLGGSVVSIIFMILFILLFIRAATRPYMVGGGGSGGFVRGMVLGSLLNSGGRGGGGNWGGGGGGGGGGGFSGGGGSFGGGGAGGSW